LFATGVVLATGFAQTGDSSYLSELPTGDRWVQHLTGDLLPFWTVPAALGDPLGSFPSVRCDDGSLLDFKKPCPPIAGSYLLTPAQYLVPVSRQTYGYGVAYHLTGDPKYLGYMKAGIDYIRKNAVDRSGGGMFTLLDMSANTWGPKREFRNPQELGYGLLGLAMYYYLTRDDQVLPDIFAIKDYIARSYYNRTLGTMQWMLENNGTQRFDQKQLVADLDQMNTYLVLLAPILPEPQRAEWQQTLTLLARSMLGTFYSPGDNLFFTSANTPQDRDLAFSGADFGHTSKALWMLRWTGLMLGDRGMGSCSEAAGRRLFDRAYLPEDGSWAQGVLRGGQTDKNKNWWIYAELDQFSGTLALGDLRAGRYLPQTAAYWFKYFVDPQYGEVWNGVNYGANTPQRDYPKAWAWKSAYHSFEHVLVGYITAQYLHGQPAKLHYAFQKPVDQALIHPYFFPGAVQSVDVTRDSAGNPYQTVTFTGPAAPAATPALAMVSAASFLPGQLAAGSIAAAFGTRLSTDTQTPPAGQLFLASPGTAVAIQDSAGARWAASLYSVSPGQVNFLVPAAAAPGIATVTATAKDGATTSAQLQIAAVSPGVFQLDLSTALAAANVVRVKADQSQSVESVYQLSPAGEVRALPIDLGPATDRVYLVLWGTGISKAKSVAVTVGGQDAGVLYWGPQGLAAGVNPGGVEQVNVGPLPRSLAGAGKVTIVLTGDGQTANPVQVSIK
ncbi:MAG: hypothetical protein NTW28_00580, partial [Candidatus Solibacter sp.]|nr:hypothetical protein [Candidatus Solibacter sp.]